MGTCWRSEEVKMKLGFVLLVIFVSSCFSFPRGMREKRSPQQRHFHNNRPSFGTGNNYSNGFRPNNYNNYNNGYRPTNYGRPGRRPGPFNNGGGLFGGNSGGFNSLAET